MNLLALFLAFFFQYQPGQAFTSCAAVTATGACASVQMQATMGQMPDKFTWQVKETGSPSGLTTNLEGSIDGGTTWATWDSSTATGGETRSVVNKPAQWMRCNVATLSGGTSPAITCLIFVK